MVYSSFEFLYTPMLLHLVKFPQKNTKKLISNGLIIAYFIFYLFWNITSQPYTSGRKGRQEVRPHLAVISYLLHCDPILQMKRLRG